MKLRSRLRQPLELVLGTLGVRLLNDAQLLATEKRYRQAVAQLCGCLTALVLPKLDLTDERINRIAALRGTEPAEGCFVLANLLESLEVPGDVCEFGVAQGMTSALLAAEITLGDRHLWLYDTFEGLPAPTAEDSLISDPLHLGALEMYTGAMAYKADLVEERLRAAGFPSERTHLVPGVVTADIDRALLPNAICFAYVDFDFHDGIASALSIVDERLSIGGHIVVDDYGFLSSGAKKATDSFFETHADRYESRVAPDWAGHFCVLHRVG